MELTQENINRLAEMLTTKGLGKAMETAQQCYDYAQKLIEQNPDKSLEELSQMVEEQFQEKEQEGRE